MKHFILCLWPCCRDKITGLVVPNQVFLVFQLKTATYCHLLYALCSPKPEKLVGGVIDIYTCIYVYGWGGVCESWGLL